MKKLIILTITTLIITVGCQQKKVDAKKNEDKPTEKTISQKIETAHKKMSFLKKEAVSFDAEISFGGNEIFNANITISTSSDIAKIVYKNGDEIYVDKQNIYVSPGLKENAGVRFHAYTWTYFFLFPYKLNDIGTKWDDNFKTQETKNALQTAKLSFKANTGDAPNDWYITYSDKQNNMLKHVAYIVTAGKTKAAAEADPHGIKYNDYTTIQDIPVSTNWGFYEWNLNEGLTNKIGNGKITNIKFITDFRSNFKIPKNYLKK